MLAGATAGAGVCGFIDSGISGISPFMISMVSVTFGNLVTFVSGGLCGGMGIMVINLSSIAALMLSRRALGLEIGKGVLSSA